jgi:hypothetical protein
MAFGYKDTDATWDDVFTTTFRKVHREFVDNIFTARPLAFFLAQAGQVVQIDGGVQIQESIVGATNANTDTYSGTDTLNTAETEEVTSAIYPWRQLASAVTVTGLEEAQNAGEAAIMDLLNVKIEVARESIVEKMNNMFHGDGTGNGGKDFNGLANLIGTRDNTVGGINAANNSWWNPYHKDVAAGGGTPAALSLGTMYNAFNGASVGSDTPGFVLMEQTPFEQYEGLLDDNRRYVDSSVADAGFQALQFKGKPVLFDTDSNFASPATNHFIYFINPKYLRLKVHSDRFFKAGPFIQPTNQDLRTMKMLTYGNLVVNNRSRHAVLETNGS